VANKGQAIFMVLTDLRDPAYEEEFNAWYDTEHLLEVLSLPGVLDGSRYVAVKGGPKYLAMYELESVEAMKTREFMGRTVTPWGRRVTPSVLGKNLTRVVGEQIFPDGLERADRGMAPALQIGRMSVPSSSEAEWNAWYNGEYILGQRAAPGVIYARRFKVVEGNVDYTTVYEFENEQVPESVEWGQQRKSFSPNAARLFGTMTHAAGSPGVYRRIGRS
jgi:hypothetical protein